MSDKETSSGEEQESEPGIDPENQKKNLSSEENGRSIQEELKKVSGHSKGVEIVLQELGSKKRKFWLEN